MARYAIYGAGSLGTVLGAFITQNGGEVDLINRNKAHVEALNTNGAKIIGTVEYSIKNERMFYDNRKIKKCFLMGGFSSWMVRLSEN